MPRYRIFHLKDSHLATFRQAAPKKPPYRVKLRYYDETGAIEAVNPYAAWKSLQGDEPDRGDAEFAPENRIFGVGDVLEAADSTLFICHYWGFESAEWILPENEFNRGQIVGDGAGSEDAESENALHALPAGAR
jgi:hypothetical protein